MPSPPRLPAPRCRWINGFCNLAIKGSLPKERVFAREHITSGEAFVAMDRLLDTARSGPVYLRQPGIADLVLHQLHAACSKGLCSLHAFVVMPNHVHVLWTPEVSLPVLIRSVKGPTARSANQLLARTGKPFWQEEYFDRLVRNDAEFCRIRRYIEWNPVGAALVGHPEEFPNGRVHLRDLQVPRGLKARPPIPSPTSTFQTLPRM